MAKSDRKDGFCTPESGSILYRILLPIVGMALLGMVLLSLLGYSYTRSEAQLGIEHLVESQVEKLDLLIEERISRWSSELNLLAGESPVSQSQALSYLKIHLNDLDDYLYCFHGRPDGFYVTTLGDTNTLTDRRYFQEVLKTRRTVVSEPLYSKTTGLPMMVIVSPLIRGGKLSGLLGGVVPLYRFSDLINSESQGNTSYAFMVDSNQRIIAHPNTNLLLSMNLSNLDTFGPALAEKMRHEPKGWLYAVSTNDRTIHYYRQIGFQGWYLVFSVDDQRFFGRLERLTVQFFGVSIFFGLLLSLLLLFYLMRFVLRPLRMLEGAARDIGRGDLSVRADVHSKGEFGMVAKTVNDMSDNLSRMMEELKAARDDAEKSEKRFRELAECLPQTVFELDENGVFVYVNRAGCERFGYRPEEVMGKVHVTRMFVARERELVIRNMKARAEGLLQHYPDYTALSRSGEEFTVQIYVMPVLDDGHFKGFRGLLVDISSRIATEKMIEKEKELLAVTLASINDAVITCSREGKIQLYNQAAAKLLDLDMQSALEMDIRKVLRLKDEKSDQKKEIPIGLVGQIGKAIEWRSVVLERSNGWCTAEVSGAPVIDHEGQVLGSVWVIRDTTSRRWLEEQALRADKMESLTLLSGGLAHDFNNILTIVLGNLTLAAMQNGMPDEARTMLSEAEKAAYRARGLTQQLLALSRGGSPTLTAAALGQILKESSELVLTGSNCRLVWESDEPLWNAMVDPAQIHQVMNNLVLNARQSMQPQGGEIRVTAKNIELDSEHTPIGYQPGGYVTVTVGDQGPGIPLEYRSRIFDPYYTTREGGHGLGLAIVHSIIEKHNGWLNLDSEVGKGTRVTFYLPAEPELQVSEKLAPRSASLKGRRVIVLEDEVSIIQYLESFFRMAGIEAECFTRGEDLLRRYGEALEAGRPFDLLLLDWTIPGGMGGKETMRKVLEIDPNANGILTSGYSEESGLADYKEYGFKGVLQKPYKSDELVSLLARFLASESHD